MKLVKPSLIYKEQIMAYRKAFFYSGEHLYGGSSLQNFEEFEEWLEKVKDQEIGENLPPNRVPATQFLSIDNGELIGLVNIRHQLTPKLMMESGHIGYSVHPDLRRMGYATKQLHFSLIEAKKFGMEKVLITCDKTNIASAKTIQKVGGILENEVLSSDTNEVVQRYWISLT
ncbi:GNAT family N-acetyltransferase [Bacillus sp. PS06]|uniref:GNAT family N-acetyltransferase n=1 Tax=Bacillus sp. PS06 TaxID=2764176 RepID=UPI0017850A22|nr:GNAT family N-acetyltransferase [Bacillus sp. PS06]MBD8069722.1 GNAT family N-acetyltransferase [Bacillus sp. PS06]